MREFRCQFCELMAIFGVAALSIDARSGFRFSDMRDVDIAGIAPLN